MRKTKVLLFIFSLGFLTFFFLTQPLERVSAQSIGTICGDASTGPTGPCDAGLSCIDKDGEGTRFECGTVSTIPKDGDCKVAETACIGDMVCSPNGPGDPNGKCKAITQGLACDKNNPDSCGASVGNQYKCEQNPEGAGYTCQTSGCDPMDIGYECAQKSYYCVAEKDAAPICKYLPNPPKLPPPPGGPCAEGQMNKDEGKCKGVYTALGMIATDPGKFISSIFSILLAGSGAIALLLIMRAGYKIMTSEGKPESLKEGKDQLIAAVVGLIFLVFAFVFLELIGVDILRLPGFGGSAKIPISKGGACTIGESICADNRTCYNKDNDKKGQPGTCQ